MTPVKIGLVGCGTISKIYCQNARRLEAIEIAACTDLVPERAQERATEYGIPKVYGTVAELLADPEIEIILNLTIPAAHAEVALAAIAAGKSVYGEKPLAVTREDGQRIVAQARERGVRVGSAPDTFLGAGLQTCREVIDAGTIGEPVAAVAFMLGHGPEGWHPDPDFYYQAGGGPMYDMGPYYLTALVSLIGPVRRVTGSARVTSAERVIGSEPKRGQIIHVNTPTHIAGVMDFAAGAVGTIITSFDVWGANVPRIEVYGTLGSLSVPDPNTFGGPVRLLRAGTKEWEEVPVTRAYADNSRGIGLADMATALRSGRPHRANGDLAYHVLDLMHAFHDASAASTHITVESTCDRPAALPANLTEGALDT